MAVDNSFLMEFIFSNKKIDMEIGFKLVHNEELNALFATYPIP